MSIGSAPAEQAGFLARTRTILQRRTEGRAVALLRAVFRLLLPHQLPLLEPALEESKTA